MCLRIKEGCDIKIARGARYIQGLNGEIMTEELIVFSSDKKLCFYSSKNRDVI